MAYCRYFILTVLLILAGNIPFTAFAAIDCGSLQLKLVTTTESTCHQSGTIQLQIVDGEGNGIGAAGVAELNNIQFKVLNYNLDFVAANEVTGDIFKLSEIASGTYTVDMRALCGGNSINFTVRDITVEGNYKAPELNMVKILPTMNCVENGGKILVDVQDGLPNYSLTITQITGGSHTETQVKTTNGNVLFDNLGIGNYKIEMKDFCNSGLELQNIEVTKLASDFPVNAHANTGLRPSDYFNGDPNCAKVKFNEAEWVTDENPLSYYWEQIEDYYEMAITLGNTVPGSSSFTPILSLEDFGKNLSFTLPVNYKEFRESNNGLYVHLRIKGGNGNCIHSYGPYKLEDTWAQVPIPYAFNQNCNLKGFKFGHPSAIAQDHWAVCYPYKIYVFDNNNDAYWAQSNHSTTVGQNGLAFYKDGINDANWQDVVGDLITPGQTYWVKMFDANGVGMGTKDEGRYQSVEITLPSVNEGELTPPSEKYIGRTRIFCGLDGGAMWLGTENWGKIGYEEDGITRSQNRVWHDNGPLPVGTQIKLIEVPVGTPNVLASRIGQTYTMTGLDENGENSTEFNIFEWKEMVGSSWTTPLRGYPEGNYVVEVKQGDCYKPVTLTITYRHATVQYSEPVKQNTCDGLEVIFGNGTATLPSNLATYPNEITPPNEQFPIYWAIQESSEHDDFLNESGERVSVVKPGEKVFLTEIGKYHFGPVYAPERACDTSNPVTLDVEDNRITLDAVNSYGFGCPSSPGSGVISVRAHEGSGKFKYEFVNADGSPLAGAPAPVIIEDGTAALFTFGSIGQTFHVKITDLECNNYITPEITILDLTMGGFIRTSGDKQCLGESITLSCVSLPAEVTYTWYKGSVSSENIVATTNELTINNATFTNSGKYIVVTALAGGGCHDNLMAETTVTVENCATAANDTVQVVTCLPSATIDVLANDAFTRNRSDVAITILTQPQHATAIANVAATETNKNLTYSAVPGYEGMDKFEYQIECNGNIATGWVHINVVNCPDNIDLAHCLGLPTGFTWDIKKEQELDDVFTTEPFVVGDLNDDGKPEIVAAGPKGSKALKVFWGPEFTTVTTIDLNDEGRFNFPGGGVQEVYHHSFAIAKVKISPTENKSLIFINTGNVTKEVRAYDPSSSNPNTPYWSNPWPQTMRGTVNVTDFNNDGWSEMFIGNYIFDAATGVPLCNGGTENKGAAQLAETLEAIPQAANIIGDERLELVAGSQIYDVKLDLGRAANSGSMNVIKSVTPPNAVAKDGVTVVADFNNDGKLEVLVRTIEHKTDINMYNTRPIYLYLWTPHTSEPSILASTTETNSMFGVPFVGDIDGDKTVEIVTLSSNGKIVVQPGFRARRYNPAGTGSFTNLWNINHKDQSGATAMTLFDFNQDGKSEIVFRDESTLRVLDGSTSPPTVLFSTPCYSETHFEYPVVADVYGDGHARILTTSDYTEIIRTSTSQIFSGKAKLRIYGSDSKPWANARKVWNQYSYNVVNINENLTVPQYQMSPATLFAGADHILGTSDDVRPYNAFLQQQTLLNKYGEPLWILPDVTWKPGTLTFVHDPVANSVTISGTVTNIGSASMVAPISISVYKNSFANGNSIYTYIHPSPVAVGEEVPVTFTITGIKSHLPISSLVININDAGDATYIHQECNYENNREPLTFVGKILAVDDYVISDKPGMNVDIPILDNDELSGHDSEITVTLPDGTGGNTLDDPSHGSVSVTTDGGGKTIVVFDPTDPDWTGVDEFEYEISYPVDPAEPAGEKVSDIAKVYVIILDPVNTRVCEGSPAPSVTTATVAANSAAISNVKFYWYASSTGGSVVSEDASHLYTLDVNKTGYGVEQRWMEVHFTNSDNEEVIFPDRYNVEATFVPRLMYWNKAASNNNWNDPDNWLTPEGNTFGFDAIPMLCTTVHIPGNADMYPSLDATHTLREVYGNPVCDSIIYHFGSEVAKPHQLTYTKAFVHYNFGCYQTNTGGSMINKDVDYSAATMNRDRWYALSAPLKSIVTGDFSVGGFPSMWQRGFRTSRDRSGNLVGDWYDPENTTALEIGTRQNYAISLYSACYAPSTLGQDDHCNLNGLNGIFEIPYFENTNPSIAALHRLHTYTPATKTSRFYYYWYEQAGLPIEYTKFDDFVREKAYRFVFENATDKPVANFKMTVAITDKDNDGMIDDVMIGNPFISSLDFGKFFTQNTSQIENHYGLFLGGSWQVFTDPGDLVAPLQAFFIKPKGTIGQNIELIFTEDMSVLRNSSTASQLKSENTNNSDKNYLKITASNASGSTWTTLSFDKDGRNNIARLFSTDKLETPQVYTVDEKVKKNVYQLIDGQNDIRIPLGIYSTGKGKFELNFENTDISTLTSLTLEDKVLNRTFDLLISDTYQFDHTSGNLDDRFVLIIGKQNAITSIDNPQSAEINVYTSGKQLFVESGEKISEVKVTNTSGLRVFSNSSVNDFKFREKLDLGEGVYIVSVKMVNGKRKVEKIILK